MLVLLLGGLLLPQIAHAQPDEGALHFRGRVLSAQNGQPIEFATVKVLGQQRGTVTDLNGYFELKNLQPGDSLQVSHIGFTAVTIAVPAEPPQLRKFRLQPKTMATEAVTITPRENPALRLIRRAQARRQANNPRNREAFFYHSYNKTLGYLQGDSTLLEDSHLFLWESITRRRFKAPNKTKEIVLASRASGLRDMKLPFSPTRVQGLSFYENWVEVMGNHYLSPIARSALRKYDFELQDSSFTGRDTLYTIRFAPKDRSFNGFKGTMQLHTAGWGIKTISAELRPVEEGSPYGTVEIRQLHQRLRDSVWFPKQLHTEIVMDGAMRMGTSRTSNSDSTQGQADTAGTAAAADTASSTPADTASAQDTAGEAFIPLRFRVRSYIKDAHLDTSFTNRDFDNITLEFNDEAHERSDRYFQQFRVDTLSELERNTYKTIDSISQAENIQNKARFFLKLLDGRVAWGPVDFLLDRLATFNQVEKTRLGLGAQTNEQLVDWATLGGWFGYGFGDDRWKYGGQLQLHPFDNEYWRLYARYQHTLREPGRTSLSLQPQAKIYQRPAVQLDTRQIFLDKMDYIDRYEAGLYFPSLQNITHRLSFRREDRAPSYDYRYRGQRTYRLTELQFETRLAPGERFIETVTGLRRVSGDYPIFYLRYTRGLDQLGGWLSGDFSYDLLRASIAQRMPVPGWGQFLYQLKGGWLSGDLPLARMHNFRATGGDNYLGKTKTFNTMPYHAFWADRYASAFLNFRFENKGFPVPDYSPDLMLSAAAGWGELQSAERIGGPEDAGARHQFGGNTVVPNQGYYEAGIGLVDLFPKSFKEVIGTLQWFGVGVYTRFGPYAAPRFTDNLTYKMEIVLPFNR